MQHVTTLDSKGETRSFRRTMFDKIWDSHVVSRLDDQTDLLYIDLHLIHEVSSPQAFQGLEQANRKVRRPDLTLAMMDHSVPTSDRSLPVADDMARAQLEALERNCSRHGIGVYGMKSARQGIVHIVGPEQGLTQPGMTIVCGDSHTSTHGAFGCLAVGIGTSEVEHVLATQTLPQRRPKTMAIEIDGILPLGTTAKDLILHVISMIGISGGVGYAIEYRGQAVRNLSIEGRMTVCNMSIEAGARVGLIAPDQATVEYLHGRPFAPTAGRWEEASRAWLMLPSDANAQFDRTVHISADGVAPTVTWGTTPAMSVPVSGAVPRPDETSDPGQTSRALQYMGLNGGELITDLAVDRVFIGSCTNGRIEDLQAAAQIVAGRQVSDGVRAMVVPGSVPVKLAAEAQGLAEVFRAAGFEWREPGCSMCLGMNPDVLGTGERCASTSNRNFEGRQGQGGRTHLVSPAMAAAAAVNGRFVDVRRII